MEGLFGKSAFYLECYFLPWKRNEAFFIVEAKIAISCVSHKAIVLQHKLETGHKEHHHKDARQVGVVLLALSEPTGDNDFDVDCSVLRQTSVLEKNQVIIQHH